MKCLTWARTPIIILLIFFVLHCQCGIPNSNDYPVRHLDWLFQNTLCFQAHQLFIVKVYLFQLLNSKSLIFSIYKMLPCFIHVHKVLIWIARIVETFSKK